MDPCAHSQTLHVHVNVGLAPFLDRHNAAAEQRIRMRLGFGVYSRGCIKGPEKLE